MRKPDSPAGIFEILFPLDKDGVKQYIKMGRKVFDGKKAFKKCP